MILTAGKSELRGCVAIPASKSHTIRALFIAAMADGVSTIRSPLLSADAAAAARAIEAFGAHIARGQDVWEVTGVGGRIAPATRTIDVANSGTTLRILMGMAATMQRGEVLLTGDEQIRRRPAEPLAASLRDLGADIRSVHENGSAPFRVRGGLRGGHTTIDAKTSQYLTSLLLACPLAPQDSHIAVSRLNESAYVQITLDWLEAQEIELRRTGLTEFLVRGGQHYRAFDRTIPADFSSAAFFLAAGALPGNDVTCTGLDLTDSQPDKAMIDYLRRMGAEITVNQDRIRVQARPLTGVDLDLNETPDALPILAALACFAHGETRLHNVAHARIKETDRIAVMTGELRKLGANVEEREDGMVIRGGPLRGAAVQGHGDHRVVMALAVAGAGAVGPTTVTTAEAMNVTFPTFVELMNSLGGALRVDHGLPHE